MRLLALVGLRLDPADLVRRSARGRAAARSGCCTGSRGPHALAAGELARWPGRRVGGAGRRRSRFGLRRVGSVADARHELAGAHQHPGEALDALAGDLAARVRRRARACSSATRSILPSRAALRRRSVTSNSSGDWAAGQDWMSGHAWFLSCESWVSGRAGGAGGRGARRPCRRRCGRAPARGR